MNVVWIDDAVTFEKGHHRVRVSIYNYTPQSQKFNLHMVLPPGSFDYKGQQFFPSEVRDDGKVSWELPKISSTERLDINFSLNGLNKDDYDENEITPRASTRCSS